MEEPALEKSVGDDPAGKRPRISLLSRFLDLISSVPFGIVLLILLLAASLAGMLIIQENVPGFDKYYAGLSPLKQAVYGSLGLFDIYHSWYFNSLLALLSVNIILASVEKFPVTWALIRKPRVEVSERWIKALEISSEEHTTADPGTTVEKLKELIHEAGLNKPTVIAKPGSTNIFAERGAWNRLGAYAVHVALLTIFAGGFLTAQFGFFGQMRLTPGQTVSRIEQQVFADDGIRKVGRTLPFTVKCIDLEQKLIDRSGSLHAGNTIDWITRLEISDETGVREATVSLNNPFDYRGYRFFHSDALPIGKARKIRFTVKNGAAEPVDISLERNKSAKLSDGSEVFFTDFRPAFNETSNLLNENSIRYENPAAVLRITPPSGEPQTVFVTSAEKLIYGNFSIRLVDFEKVSEQHIIAVQRDPGAAIVYLGFVLLGLSLAAVFFFSHQRIWVLVEPVAEGGSRIVIGGNTNRNQTAFEEKLGKIRSKLNGESNGT